MAEVKSLGAIVFDPLRRERPSKRRVFKAQFAIDTALSHAAPTLAHLTNFCRIPDMHIRSRRQFVIQLAALTAVAGSGVPLTGCGGGDDPVPPQFDYGVASGDPWADRVILWTHAQFAGLNDDVPLTWEVASDTAFASLVASGSAKATAATGHTV